MQDITTTPLLIFELVARQHKSTIACWERIWTSQAADRGRVPRVRVRARPRARHEDLYYANLTAVQVGQQWLDTRTGRVPRRDGGAAGASPSEHGTMAKKLWQIYVCGSRLKPKIAVLPAIR